MSFRATFSSSIILWLSLTQGFAQESVLKHRFPNNFLPKEYHVVGFAKKVSVFEEVKTNGRVVNLEKEGRKFALKTEYYLDKDQKILRTKAFASNYTTVFYYASDGWPMGKIGIYNQENALPDTSSFEYCIYDNTRRLVALVGMDSNGRRLGTLTTFDYSSPTACRLNHYGEDSTLLYVCSNIYNNDGFEIRSQQLPIDEYNEARLSTTTQTFKIINGKHFLTQKYVDGGYYRHNYEYEYNNAEQLIKEVEEHAAEAVRSYVYHQDFSEMFENYSASEDMPYIKYDKWRNVVFQGHMNKKTKAISDYYTKFNYQYDARGNWTTKYEYSKPDPKQKERLVKATLRQIEYFDERDIVQYETKFPVRLVVMAAHTCKSIPSIAVEKHEKEYLHKMAINSGAYGKTITTKRAKNINDFLPKLWKTLQIERGDIMGDSTAEQVLVYEKPMHPDSTDEPGYCMAIYQRKNGFWELYGQYFKVIHSAGFYSVDAVKIEKKTLLIENQWTQGGENYYGRRFRFQNGDFYMIGSSSSSGRCEESKSFDYNLSTGRIEYEKSHYDCSSDDEPKTKLPKDVKLVLYKKLKKLPMLKNMVSYELTLQLTKEIEVWY